MAKPARPLRAALMVQELTAAATPLFCTAVLWRKNKSVTRRFKTNLQDLGGPQRSTHKPLSRPSQTIRKHCCASMSWLRARQWPWRRWPLFLARYAPDRWHISAHLADIPSPDHAASPLRRSAPLPAGQTPSEINRAENHIKWLKKNYNNVSHITIDLNNTFETFKSSVEKTENPNNNLSLANSRSRLRMTTLYYFSGIHNYLVAGTGNKVEDFGVGFYTKYGDGGVDISPIADLTKTNVFKIASKLNIIDEILKAKPTDGLWDDGRTDEDQIGASYSELEWAMVQKDNNKTPDDFTGRDKEVLKILMKFNSQNSHKMDPIPIFKVPKNLK